MNDNAERRPASRRLGSLRTLAPFVGRYRWPITFAVVFLLLAAAGALAIPAAVGQVIDRGFLADNAARIDRWFWLLFAAAAVMAVAGGLRYYWVTWLGQRIVTDIRRGVYARVMRMTPEFFAETRTGEVLSRLNTDTTLVETLVGSSASFAVRNIVMLVFSAILLVITAPGLAGVIGIMIPLIILPVLVLGRWVRRLSRNAQDRVADFSALGDETINAVGTVQTFAQEGREIDRFGRAAENAFRAARQRIGASTVLMVCVILLTFGAVTFVLWLGARSVLSGELSPGQLSQFVLYAVIAAASTASLSEVWGDVQRAAGAMERLSELLVVEPSIRAPERPEVLPQGPLGIEFEDVGFAYPVRADQPVLDGVNFAVAPGETVALVGPSGAGKSTIFQLMLRFYDPDRGGIRIGGVALDRLDPVQLRRTLGVVPQDAVMFSGTAGENIGYGCPDSGRESLAEAARRAQAAEFIEAWEGTYDTQLGERGQRLSGGQRQRMAIARALVKDPPLLLLDEATSSLDAESERGVQQALAEMSSGRTVLVIAHRLATVRRADRILVIDRGRIIAEGDHDTLVRENDLYRRLASLQFMEATDSAMEMMED